MGKENTTASKSGTKGKEKKKNIIAAPKTAHNKKRKPAQRKTTAQKKKADQTRTKASKQRILESLVKSLGIVTTACTHAGVPRRTYYDWLANDPAFRKDVEEIEDIALDFAESKLHGKISGGDTTAMIFYLKCRGKRRGYIERTEVDNSGEMNVNITRKVVGGDGKS